MSNLEIPREIQVGLNAMNGSRRRACMRALEKAAQKKKGPMDFEDFLNVYSRFARIADLHDTVHVKRMSNKGFVGDGIGYVVK